MFFIVFLVYHFSCVTKGCFFAYSLNKYGIFLLELDDATIKFDTFLFFFVSYIKITPSNFKKNVTFIM
jgi:hypothetical protein